MTVALVTGATSGLGRAVADELAGRGIDVIAHGRDPAKIPERGYRADLASLNEVRELGQALLDGEERIDILINNAGVATTQRQESADGYELDFAVNYLSHFVLTNMLIDRVDRVVNVASIGQAPIDFDDVMLEHGWDVMRAYGQSKLAQISFTFALAEKYPGKKINALHPATLMDTQMVADTFGRSMSTVADGVGPTVRLALEEGGTGQFFDQNRPREAHRQAYDASARQRLWDLSEQLGSLQPS